MENNKRNSFSYVYLDSITYLIIYESDNDSLAALAKQQHDTVCIFGGGGNLASASLIRRLIVYKQMTVIILAAYSAGVYYCLLDCPLFKSPFATIAQHGSGDDHTPRLQSLTHDEDSLQYDLLDGTINRDLFNKYDDWFNETYVKTVDSYDSNVHPSQIWLRCDKIFDGLIDNIEAIKAFNLTALINPNF